MGRCPEATWSKPWIRDKDTGHRDPTTSPRTRGAQGGPGIPQDVFRLGLQSEDQVTSAGPSRSEVRGSGNAEGSQTWGSKSHGQNQHAAALLGAAWRLRDVGGTSALWLSLDKRQGEKRPDRSSSAPLSSGKLQPLESGCPVIRAVIQDSSSRGRPRTREGNLARAIGQGRRGVFGCIWPR